jgi:hypothetical protein
MSLSSLYKLKQGKNAKNENQKEQIENAETLKAKLEKIAIPTDIAKNWVSDPCLPPNTIVYMENGFKPIKDVDVGENVLTSTGYGHVAEIHERRYDGELISLTPYYTNIPLHLTPNHPVLAIKTVKSCPFNKPPHFRVCLPTCSSQNNSWCPAHFKNYEPKWIPASQLEKGDAVALGYPAMNSSPCYRRPYGFKHGNLLFVCLKEVKHIPYDGLVYNLEVNPAQSYIAEGILVHNCGKPC